MVRASLRCRFGETGWSWAIIQEMIIAIIRSFQNFAPWIWEQCRPLPWASFGCVGKHTSRSTCLKRVEMVTPTQNQPNPGSHPYHWIQWISLDFIGNHQKNQEFSILQKPTFANSIASGLETVVACQNMSQLHSLSYLDRYCTSRPSQTRFLLANPSSNRIFSWNPRNSQNFQNDDKWWKNRKIEMFYYFQKNMFMYGTLCISLRIW